MPILARHIRGNAISTSNLGNDSVTGAKILDGEVANADIATDASISLSKLAAVTSANIIVGNSSNVATAVALSGDATISNTGVLSIANNAISIEHLDSGIAPAFIPVYAGTHTTVGGAATESITVTGALATDICICVLETQGASPVTLLASASNTDAIDLTFSANPAADHIVSYILFRAAA